MRINPATLATATLDTATSVEMVQLDWLVSRLTAFHSFHAFALAGLGGYSPTLIPRDINPDVVSGRKLLANVFDRTMSDLGSSVRAWRGLN